MTRIWMPDSLCVAFQHVSAAVSSVDEAASRLPRLLARLVLGLAVPMVAAGGEYITASVAEEAVDSAANVTSSAILGYLLVWYTDAVAG